MNNVDYFENRNVKPEDYDSYKLPVYLTQVLPENKKARILDIGCGFGQTLKALKKNGYENLKGVDISPASIKQCKENGLDVILIADIISFCRKSKEKYDFIIMSHVLEHIAKDKIIDTLKAIRSKIMQKGGILCITVPNAQSNTGCYWAYEDFTHTYLFTSGNIYYVLKAAGFSRINFIDKDGLAGSNILFKIFKNILLIAYKMNIRIWNWATSSAYHKPSPIIYTYELKVIAE